MAKSSHSMFKLVSLAGLCFSLLTTAETIQQCGAQPYYPSQYTCYDGFLCPVVAEERTLKCANACYLPEAYTCDNGNLKQHPLQQGGFTVHSLSSPISTLSNLQLNACGRNFYLSNSGSCTYCPDIAAKAGACARTTNTTIFWPGSGLNVMVPGGQQYYVGPDGALGFTQAHSASIPTGSELGATVAYDKGYFNYVGSAGAKLGSSSPSGWLACPTAATSAGPAWKLFARRSGLVFQAICMPVTLGISATPQDAVGAWQFV